MRTTKFYVEYEVSIPDEEFTSYTETEEFSSLEDALKFCLSLDSWALIKK